MQYSEFQELSSSEKITLAILEASKRLMGWTVHSGSIYKIENFSYAVVQALRDSGTDYTQVDSLDDVTAGKFYLDRTNKIIYVRTSASDNPNSRVLVVQIKVFLSNIPITLPHDLANGFEVFFEPLIKSTSEFGVSIDTVDQSSEAIEGKGSLSIHNDQDFWPANYDKLVFDNQPCVLYSHHRELEAGQQRIIFRGNVEQQSYGKDTISFQLKDQFAELRAPVELADISELEERTGTDIENAKQRMVLGKVFGIIPTNLDQVLEGYPLTGTIAINFNDVEVVGTGTQFLAQVSPDDRIVLLGEEYTVATVDSNTSLTLTEEYVGDENLSAYALNIIPNRPKRYMNRRFLLAGHPLREAVTTTEAGSIIDRIFVNSTRDLYAGDTIYMGDLGSGEITFVDEVSGEHYVSLRTSLGTVPPVGTEVRRPAIQNVRIDGTLLQYYRDYTFDPETAVLTLRNTAEANAGPIRHLASAVTFTNSSRSVTGSGFLGVIEPGHLIGMVGNSSFFEVLSVDSDTEITLRTPATFSATDTLRYKSLIYDPGSMVITCDLLGRTDDGTTDGILLKTAPAITKALLQDVGLGGYIDEDSFDDAQEIAYQEVGLIVPSSFDDTQAPTYRDVMNKINKSVFGALVQDSEFLFAYQVLQLSKPTGIRKFTEPDLLTFNFNATSSNAVRLAKVEYRSKEHDYLTLKAGVSTHQATSEHAVYVLKTNREKVISTCLVNSTDAQIAANRWAFLLQGSTGRLRLTTKLQGIDLNIGDIVEIEHRKFFERYGSTGKRKLLMIESIARSGSAVNIEATDLSNTFNRVACINDFSNAWSDATESERLFGGYISDEYGLIDSDPASFESNLIW